MTLATRLRASLGHRASAAADPTPQEAQERAGLAASNERLARFFPLAIILYFMIQFLLRSLISDGLEIDEAEIATHPFFAFGYGNSQPPLYDWLVIATAKLLGNWPVAVAGVKNALLGATYLLMYDLGRRLSRRATTGVLVSASLLLLPQIVWQSQVTLSHAVLAAAAAAAVLHAVVLLLEAQTTRRFLWLGVAAGIGLLSKYSILLLYFGLAVSIVSWPNIRRRFADRRLVFALVVALLIASPHLVWFFLNLNLAGKRMYHVMQLDPLWSRIDIPRIGLDGFASLCADIVLSGGPLVLVWLTVRQFKAASADPRISLSGDPLIGSFAWQGIVAGLALTTVGVLAADLHVVQHRYFTPLLMLLPIGLLLRMPIEDDPRTVRRFLGAAFATAILVTIAWPQTVLFGTSRLAYPYRSVAATLADTVGPPMPVISTRSDFTTNIVLRWPGSSVMDQSARPPRALMIWIDKVQPIEKVLKTGYRVAGDVRSASFGYHNFSGRRLNIFYAPIERVAEQTAPDPTKTETEPGTAGHDDSDGD